ncbi:MAG TPA: aldehyde dehydrogenase family protein [Polyangiaceae bacterium]
MTLGSGPNVPYSDLDRSLSRLREQAPRLGRLPAAERGRLLLRIAERFHELAPRFVELDCRAKGIPLGSSREGEPGFDGPAIILRYLAELSNTLTGEKRLAPSAVREQHGRRIVTVSPRDGYEALIFPDWKAEAWLEAGYEGPASRSPHDLAHLRGEVSLVLGAGNVASIGVVDALQQCFVFGRACLFKPSPVNAYLTPLLELAFAPLVKEGWFAFAQGGADVGAYLTTHPAVDAVHVTGSRETHEAIVWGSDPAAARARKAQNAPLCAKHVTSELGNVSPAVVVPGRWEERDIEHAARSIAGSFTFNAGFNCNATKLVVTPRGWPLRERLLAAVGRVLERTPTRRAYYPGASEKYARFTSDLGRVQKFGAPAEGEVAWALVSDLDPESNAACFDHEPFCAVLSEVALPHPDPVEFLAESTRFLNERVWGTLNAMLLVPRAVEADPTLAAALDRAIGELRYGSVCVNVWPAAAYGIGTLPWGGHPSDTLANVQSGVGWGHNALLLEGVEKGVMRAPLVPLLKPLWYADHRTLPDVASRFSDFAVKPNVWQLTRLAGAALRG